MEKKRQKKGNKILIIILILLIIVLGLIIFINNNKTNKYENIIKELENKTNTYLEDDSSLNYSYNDILSIKNDIFSEIENINELNCNGYIHITTNNNKLVPKTYIKCGNKYETEGYNSNITKIIDEDLKNDSDAIAITNSDNNKIIGITLESTKNKTTYDAYTGKELGNYLWCYINYCEDRGENSLIIYKLEEDRISLYDKVEEPKKDDETYLVDYYIQLEDDEKYDYPFKLLGLVDYEQNRFYNLNTKEWLEFDENIVSAGPLLSLDESRYTFNENYIVVGNNYYDYNNKKYLFKENYKDIVPVDEDKIIASKDGKNYGMINLKEEVLIPFEYEFINYSEIANENSTTFTVVKDNKIAIMNNNYELISNFEVETKINIENKKSASEYFDCRVGTGPCLTFGSYEIDGDYYIIIYIVDFDKSELEYNTEVYILNDDKSFTKTDKKYIYDEENNERYLK